MNDPLRNQAFLHSDNVTQNPGPLLHLLHIYLNHNKSSRLSSIPYHRGADFIIHLSVSPFPSTFLESLFVNHMISVHDSTRL